MTERERGLIDPMFLACEVLGMDFQINPHDGLFKCFLESKIDVPIGDLSPIKKRMIIWSRGTFKTSAVRVKIIQTILNYPNCRILIGAAALPLGKVQLEAVKRVFENPSPKFRELYPEFCGTKLGNTTRFTVPNRTDFTSPEETVTTSTARSVKSGSHYDFVFIDDLVNDQNYRNPVALEQCWKDYLDFGPLRDPSGYLFVTGTPYSFGDTYEKIEDSAREDMKLGRATWLIEQRSCWSEICKTCGKTELRHHDPKVICAFKESGEKELLFPQVRTPKGKTVGHTREFLESEKAQDEEFFILQYECVRMSKGLQTFTDELLNAQTLFHLSQIPMENSWIFIMGDLSYIGDPRKRDKSVFYIVRVCAGQLFPFECIAEKWNASQVGEGVLRMLMTWRPRIIWLEAFLGWEAYDTVIRMMAAQMGIQKVPIEWIPLDQQEDAKMIRIGSVQAWLTQKKLWYFAGMTHFEKLKEQQKKWPKFGRFDDFADCMGLVCNAPHGVALERIPQSAHNMRQKITRIHFPQGDPRSIVTPEQEEQYSFGKAGSLLNCG